MNKQLSQLTANLYLRSLALLSVLAMLALYSAPTSNAAASCSSKNITVNAANPNIGPFKTKTSVEIHFRSGYSVTRFSANGSTIKPQNHSVYANGFIKRAKTGKQLRYTVSYKTKSSKGTCTGSTRVLTLAA